ncbi:hypothetical protein [Commensalibacter communis]|uniref:Uncharacterized protein n=1 Tax=Commensalibacter communis TaxID=2972786 RepID=A0A9W4TLU1_9PROT|nr:hypothetical protein [Commensalibacter communis]CAI3934004.1 unnamed protein product [Commensalibacter communis]CAI3935996.1 unnamed protein product [Commensalibacter communis]CAI3942323.1 unnamed protein product [Commensalibacter communis]CAI3944205.1 unnamed protein product [Commensalibacter communis]CAI3944353.1 unnamed protein product [Commensalibacter communis]
MNDTKELIEQELKDAICAIAINIADSVDKEIIQDKIYKYFSKLNLPFHDVENLHYLFFQNITQAAEACLTLRVDKKNQQSENYILYCHFVLKYPFFYNHIRKMTESLEGSSCCADRARLIVKEVAYFLLNGEYRNLKDIYCSFSIPNQPIKAWVEFVHSLYNFYHGDATAYLSALQRLYKAQSNSIELMKKKIKTTGYR